MEEEFIMTKPKGSIYIQIGSIGMIVLGSLAILASPLLIVLSVWSGRLISGLDFNMEAYLDNWNIPFEYLTGQLITGFGVVLGILVLFAGLLQLILAVLALKRRNDLHRSTLPLTVGIIFTALSLPASLTGWGILQLAFPVLLIVGAALNKQERNRLASQAPPPYYHYQPPAPPPEAP